ncbi:hypothetical protein LLEC1_07418 [Akanthomyces lecanii]|uniref:Uncharacterized protein n=1 Tax=Cordyceps confragosa TaxID=2714763 RepID=A0A179IMB1_CORDF|nr:hypothetical protein LLEC1_07418 [Akanthomyces lecanii]
MRTYDDTFSGQRIYPGKVRPSPSPPPVAMRYPGAAIERSDEERILVTPWVLGPPKYATELLIALSPDRLRC